MALPALGVEPEGGDLFRFIESVGTRTLDLYHFLIFSSLLLCSECVAMAFVSCRIQEIPLSAMTVIIPFFAAFSIYNLNRKTDEDEDAINRQERYAFTKRHEHSLYYGAFISMAICLVLSASCNALSLLVTSTPFILGILYSFRLLPERFGYQRLKEIPGVKNIIVGLAWGIPLSCLPVFISGNVPDSRTVVAFFLFFLWGFMASMIPDIRDRNGDARAGVRTVPVLYGEDATRRLITLVLLGLGIPVVLFSFFFLPVSTTILLLAANAYSHGCVYLSEKAGLLDVVADAFSDGQYIFMGAGIVFTATVFPLL